MNNVINAQKLKSKLAGRTPPQGGRVKPAGGTRKSQLLKVATPLEKGTNYL